MAKPILSPVESSVRQVRRRMLIQSLLNRIGIAWGLGLALALVWFFVEPLAVPTAAQYLKWTVLAGLVGSFSLLAIWVVRRTAPSRLAAALALDQRFELAERATTAVSLEPELQQTAAGAALLSDANAKLQKVVVKERFPVRIGWRAAFIPLLAAGVLLLALFPVPVQRLWAEGKLKLNSDEGKEGEQANLVKPAPPRTFIKPPVERPNKSEDLRKLEAELERLYAEHNKEQPTDKEKPEQTRERQEKISAAEERLKKREQELAEKFQKLQEQMEKATQLDNGEARQDGPAKDFEQALAKGDLKKAEEEADRLKKKAKDKKIEEKEKEQLKKQLADMEDRIERLTREQEKKKKQLKELVEKAKRENRDAESLERELKQLEQECQQSKEMQDLAKSIKQARQALEKDDFEGLSEEFGQIAKSLESLQEELKDLEDIEEHLQNLKQMKKEGCKNCEGEGKKKGEGGEKDDATGYAEGATGRRAENKDAQSKAGEEQRVRGFFDPKGRKTYGGAVNGPAFKKATSVEMAGEIQQAVQEAPEAVEIQRLPKATKEMVKEYFEKLGGQAPPPKK